VGLEEQSLEPAIERNCVECGAKLTEREIQDSLDSGGPYLCTIHAQEQVPIDDEAEALDSGE
jgi:hypothetical protein